MNKHFLAACVLLSTFFGSLSALEESDQESIHGIIQGYITAWNENGGKGFGDHYTDDADFVNIFGMQFSGREEIESRHIKIVGTIFKDSFFEALNISLREVYQGLVIATVKWQLDGFRWPGTSVNEVRQGMITQVFIKQNGKWEITAAQNTLIPN